MRAYILPKWKKYTPQKSTKNCLVETFLFVARLGLNEILDNPVQNLSNQSDEKVRVQFKYNGNSIIYCWVLIYVLIYLLLRSLFKTIKTKTTLNLSYVALENNISMCNCSSKAFQRAQTQITKYTIHNNKKNQTFLQIKIYQFYITITNPIFALPLLKQS